LLVALRDGDLIAQGRYTEDRPNGWGYGASSGFGLHSGYHSSIRPEQWREGRFFIRPADGARLGVHRHPHAALSREGDLAGLRPEVDRPAAGADKVPYTTPYLELMQAAIAKFGITAEDQGKKDCLVDWFLEQEIEGEPVSNKLADAMATLIRLPSAQRGGAKRVMGPDLRQTG
jgi:hypothetical protein